MWTGLICVACFFLGFWVSRQSSATRRYFQRGSMRARGLTPLQPPAQGRSVVILGEEAPWSYTETHILIPRESTRIGTLEPG
jgi:hypothetical protein